MRFLGRLALQVLGNAIGLVAADAMLDDVSLSVAGLLIDVLVFTAVSVLVLPLLQQQAIRGSGALLGSSALVATLVALVVTVAVSDGLRISGLATWISATVIVWSASLLAGVVLPSLFVKRRLADRRRRP